MRKIVCLYGGPGSGKSTACAGLYHRLKLAGYNAEMNREYIKDWVWEGRRIKPGDQTYFFAKQARRERQYMEQGLDVIITDSPLIMTHFYGLKYDAFEQEFNTSLAMLAQHHAIVKHFGYTVDHFVLSRPEGYDTAGRYQSEEDARQMDNEIEEMLTKRQIRYVRVGRTPIEDILGHLEA